MLQGRLLIHRHSHSLSLDMYMRAEEAVRVHLVQPINEDAEENKQDQQRRKLVTCAPLSHAPLSLRRLARPRLPPARVSARLVSHARPRTISHLH
jgi:hypothetical protein